MGAKHYVELAESELLENIDPECLDSVKMLFPAGSSVPSDYEPLIRTKFRNLKGILNVYNQSEFGVVSAGYETDNLGMNLMLKNLILVKLFQLQECFIHIIR